MQAHTAEFTGVSSNIELHKAITVSFCYQEAFCFPDAFLMAWSDEWTDTLDKIVQREKIVLLFWMKQMFFDLYVKKKKKSKDKTSY